MGDDHACALAASEFSYQTAEALHTEWLEFFGELFATYVDGYTMTPTSAINTVIKRGNKLRGLIKAEIASQTGARYRLPGKPPGSERNLIALPIDKWRLRSIGRMHDVDNNSLDVDLNDDGFFGFLLVGITAFAVVFVGGVFVGRRVESSLSRQVHSGSLKEPLSTKVGDSSYA